MKIVLAALFAAAALVQAAPAPATTGYEVVNGVGYPKNVVAGPFDSLSKCDGYMSANGWHWPYHCEQVTY